MPRGKPDWSPNNPRSVLDSVDDLAASIVRLGGNAGFNRGGIPIWSDDFDKGLPPYTINLDGTGAAVALDTAISFLGKQSVKITSGSDSARFANIQKYLTYIGAGILRFELFFTTFSDATTISLIIQQTKDAVLNSAQLTLSFTTDNVLILNSAGANQIEGTFDWSVTGNPFWHVISLAVNLEDLMYEDISLDNVLLDISDEAMRSVASSGENRLLLSCQVGSGVGDNGVINVDNFSVSVS